MEKILQIQVLMDFGYIEGTSKVAKGNNVLVIPEREGIIVYKDGLYGVINSSGRTLLKIQLKKVYAEMNNGKNNYYMVYGDENKTENILDYLNRTIGGTTSTNKNTTGVNNETTNSTNTVRYK
ncbi:MAG: hypothetical protein J6D03_02020 [Clostridia bacterium]|nr:hypothetical protein [Clostridia bacterium]